MGANSTKKEILQILQKSIQNQTINEEKKALKIDYKLDYQRDLDEEKNPLSDKKENEDNKENEENEEIDSFEFSFDDLYPEKYSPFDDVKNIKKYPYYAIGTITVQFPVREEINICIYLFFN